MSGQVTSSLTTLRASIKAALDNIVAKIDTKLDSANNFDNTGTGLVSTDVLGAISEIKGIIDNLNSVYNTDADAAAQIVAINNAWAAADQDITTLLNTKVSVTTYTAADILSKLLTIDGPGSDLNADLLDGYDAQTFLDADSTLQANITAEVNARVALAASTAAADTAETNARVSADNALQVAVDAKIPLSQKGVANGVATLDGSGLIPTNQLPSYVDDVLDFANLAAFPGTGISGKIYVALDSSDIYRWSGSSYIKVSDAVSMSDAATKLATARNIVLGGDATGSVAFDGSSNVTLSVTVNDDSHNHVIGNVDGLSTSLASKALATDLTNTNTRVDAAEADILALDVNANATLSKTSPVYGTSFGDDSPTWVNNGSNVWVEDTDALTYGKSGRFKTVIVSADCTDNTGQPYLEIPADVAMGFSGRRITVMFRAKKPVTNGSNSFSVGYSTSGSGNSTWHAFTPTTAWQVFSFQYDVQFGIPTGPSTDFIGVMGDNAGTGKEVLIDDLYILLDASDYAAISGNTAAIATISGRVSTAETTITSHTNTLTTKVNITDIKDNLTSSSTNTPLSAKQGMVLKGLIDSINTLLSSDTTTLNEMQEIVDYIKLNRADLDALSIASIGGLQSALDGKLSITGKAADAELLDGINSTGFVRTNASYIGFGNGQHNLFDNNALGDSGISFGSSGALMKLPSAVALIANVDGGSPSWAIKGLTGTVGQGGNWTPYSLYGHAGNGSLRWGSNDIFHTGNLNPADKMDIASFTAAAILSKLLQADGVGSGLDADLLGGVSHTDYLTVNDIIDCGTI